MAASQGIGSQATKRAIANKDTFDSQAIASNLWQSARPCIACLSRSGTKKEERKRDILLILEDKRCQKTKGVRDRFFLFLKIQTFVDLKKNGI